MLISMLVAFAQLIDSFVRWLAFSTRISLEISHQLRLCSILWSLASVLLYNFIFNQFGLTSVTYKAILMTGWLPYFLIAMRFIPWGLAQHIFVFGMGVICSVVQHSIVATIILLNVNFQSDSELILLEATGYLLAFIIFLPVCWKFFIKLLPSREFFDFRPQGICIAILPLTIMSGHLILLADDILVHSWAERLSRIYLPLIFFFFYRYILLAAKNFYDLQRSERNKILLEEKLTRLKEYNEQIQENQKKISVIRHDLRHNYNLIYAMLEDGNIEKAREHIYNQKNLLLEKVANKNDN